MRIPNPTARFGENVASKLLENKGYKIIERNFRKGYGEIDIVALYKNTLIFIEVKTRTTGLYGGALEAITYFKLKTLVKTAQYYKITHKNLPDLLRIDAVLIDLNSDNTVKRIEHIENISL